VGQRTQPGSEFSKHTEGETPSANRNARHTYQHELILLALFRASRSAAAGMITLAFPYLVLQSYHRSALSLGLLYTAASLSTAVFGLAVGFLADHWGRKKSLVLVAVTLPVSSAIAYLSHGMVWLFAAAMLGGYSATGSLMGGGVGGAGQPIQGTILASLSSSRERTFFFSLFTFMGGVLAATGSLVARFFTARDAFAVATLISASGLVFLLPLRLPELAKGTSRAMKSLRIISQFSLTGLLNGFSQGLIAPFLIPFFFLVYKLPKERMATYAFAAGLLGSVALLTAPVLDRAFGFVRSIAVTRGTGALLLALMPFAHHIGVALAIYILTPALRVAALPAQQRAITDIVAPSETGRALGLNQVTRLGASSGAVALTGFLFSESEIALPFLIYGVLMAANIGLYFKFFSRFTEELQRKASGTN
jgi:predicted MFS family arabinose efflux permease